MALPALLILAWLCVLPGLAGCSDLTYYWQAGMGQLEILNKRRPISEVLADDGVAPEVKEKLNLVLRVQKFAVEGLALPKGSQFKYYADLERKVVSWMVVASQPFAIKEIKQCYLIVGCLGYRGFFDRQDADQFAEEMKGRSYDVLVRPIRAYSTLGWFDDPVLSTYLRSGKISLVSTLIHEQAHQVLFIKGDTDFNESFATLVAEEGLRRFLEADGEDGQAQLTRLQVRQSDQALFKRIVAQGKTRLEKFYAQRPLPEDKARIKAKLFLEMRKDFENEKSSFKILSYEGWFNQELNNAHLLGIRHYRSRVAAFRVLFRQSGNDFSRFYEAVKALSRQPREEREARLNALEGERIAKS